MFSKIMTKNSMNDAKDRMSATSGAHSHARRLLMLTVIAGMTITATPVFACDLNPPKPVVGAFQWPATSVMSSVIGSENAAPGSDNRKEFHFTLSADSSLVLSNHFGNISVKPSTGHQVVIIALIQGNKDQVEVDSHQHPNGKRIEVETHMLQGAPTTTRVDYEVYMPVDAALTVECSSGEVTVEGIKGAINIETETAGVVVRNIQNGQRVHVQTVDGTVNLNGLKSTNVEVTSIGGNVELYGVTGRNVDVMSTSGMIRYTGNFTQPDGQFGQYKFHNHTGNIDVLIPSDASVEINAKSRKGSVENDFPLDPAFGHSSALFSAKPTGSTLVGTRNHGDSKIDLRSFSGKIRVKKQ